MGLPSEAAVCNLALQRVGQRQLIDSLDEATTEAIACKTSFAIARDSVLESHWWRFATKRVALSLAPDTSDAWTYVYVRPSDCLQPRRIWSGQRVDAEADEIPFALEASAIGDYLVICTDEADAQLIYTKTSTNTSLWSASFTEAVAWRLAVDLTLVLPVKPQFASIAESMAKLRLAEAKAKDASEAKTDPEPEAGHIRAR